MLSFRISDQSFPNQRLEVVNNTELQVVCAEVEAESLLTVRTSNLVVVVVAVTEETERSDEVNVLCEAYLNARLDSYFPRVVRLVAVVVLILCAVSVEAEATVENQGNWTNLGCSVAGEWSNAYAVNLQTIIVVVVVAYLDTESPLAVEVITNLWSYVECCMVVIGVTPETNFTTYKTCALAATVITKATNVR